MMSSGILKPIAIIVGVTLALLSTCSIFSKPLTGQKSLIKQNIDNMIFVPGGNFMMGDGSFTNEE